MINDLSNDLWALFMYFWPFLSATGSQKGREVQIENLSPEWKTWDEKLGMHRWKTCCTQIENLSSERKTWDEKLGFSDGKLAVPQIENLPFAWKTWAWPIETWILRGRLRLLRSCCPAYGWPIRWNNVPTNLLSTPPLLGLGLGLVWFRLGLGFVPHLAI